MNSLLIAGVLVFFFMTRTVGEEFFIRKNINNVFDNDNMLTMFDSDSGELIKI